MSRMTVLAVTILLASSANADADLSESSRIRHINFQNAEQANELTYEDLSSQLAEARAELAIAEERLDAATNQPAMDQEDTRELQELRHATGFHAEDTHLTQYNAEPQGGGDSPGPGGDMGAMATQAQNPVGAMWMLWFQNDMKMMEGPVDGKRIFNTTVFQPVMPVQLTEKWRVINRPVFMMNSFEVPGGFTLEPPNSFPPGPPADPFSTDFGLGDTIFAQYFSASPTSAKFLWGIGETWMFPTASKDSLGTGKTALGPAALGMWLGEKLIAGAIMQQWWSIGGADSRQRVALMDIQVPFRYRVNPMTSFGGAPNIQWDQVSGKWTVPIGIGFDTITMTSSKKPIRFGAELQYFPSHRDRPFDPEWNFRMFFVPIIPAPEWAKNPIFGGGGCRCRSCRHGRRCRHG